MVKMVFENSKFLPLKIACKTFVPMEVYIYRRKFLQAILIGKNFEFSKTVFAIRFLRLWRMLLVGVQKFLEISKKNLRLLTKTWGQSRDL